MAKIKAFVFDAYGTLFDVHSAAAKYKDDIGADWDRLSQTWRAKHLEYSWIYGRIGQPKTFWELTAASLDYAVATVGGVPVGVRDNLLNAYMTLDAYPEVREVLAGLKASGAMTAILSNGDPKMLDAAVASAGIGGVLDASISVSEAGTFKPDFKVYELATARFQCTPGEICFQSSNRWDAAAAKAFGCDVVWINRFAMPAEYDDLTPDRTVSDLRPLLEMT